jgi:hypothetical protein
MSLCLETKFGTSSSAKSAPRCGLSADHVEHLVLQ